MSSGKCSPSRPDDDRLPAPSYDHLAFEWDCCWAAQDVEAAAELGRTLLERNRELETTIRQLQAVLEDQSQEMQYLSKKNTILRQAAESRLRLCEQLEMSAVDTERTKSRLRSDLHSERQRHQILKANLEAAEERCDELQRLLDQSRAAETQTRQQLRTLQQQQRWQQQQLRNEEEPPDAEQVAEPIRSESDADAVLRLVEDLAELEDRLHAMEKELIDEKRRRQQLELELVVLQQENKSVRQSGCDQSRASPSTPPPGIDSKGRNLSLGEELLLSSDDFASSQWRDAWDNSGPMSLIGDSGLPDSGKAESSADCAHSISASQSVENEDSYSSSSGFSEEQRPAQAETARRCCHLSCAYCVRLQQQQPQQPQRTERAKSTQQPVDSCDADQPVTQEDESDYKALFREIFAVIKQNL